MPRGKTYWMVADSVENFRITRELGFTVQGMASRQRRKAQRMESGDRLLFYITRDPGVRGHCNGDLQVLRGP